MLLGRSSGGEQAGRRGEASSAMLIPAAEGQGAAMRTMALEPGSLRAASSGSRGCTGRAGRGLRRSLQLAAGRRPTESPLPGEGVRGGDGGSGRGLLVSFSVFNGEVGEGSTHRRCVALVFFFAPNLTSEQCFSCGNCAAAGPHCVLWLGSTVDSYRPGCGLAAVTRKRLHKTKNGCHNHQPKSRCWRTRTTPGDLRDHPCWDTRGGQEAPSPRWAKASSVTAMG